MQTGMQMTYSAASEERWHYLVFWSVGPKRANAISGIIPTKVIHNVDLEIDNFQVSFSAAVDPILSYVSTLALPGRGVPDDVFA